MKATPRVRSLFEHLAAGLTDFVRRPTQAV